MTEVFILSEFENVSSFDERTHTGSNPIAYTQSGLLTPIGPTLS